MQEDQKNTPPPEEKKKEITREYFFPEHHITIKATSIEEAKAKLVELGKKEVNKK